MTEQDDARGFAERFARALEWYDAARKIQLRAMRYVVVYAAVYVVAAVSAIGFNLHGIVPAALYAVAIVCLHIAQNLSTRRRDEEISALGPKPSLDS